MLRSVRCDARSDAGVAPHRGRPADPAPRRRCPTSNHRATGRVVARRPPDVCCAMSAGIPWAIGRTWLEIGGKR